jgi:outer membrane protein OmpA-like peptidoglycan-associated protein
LVAGYSKSFFKPAHYAIQVQKNRIRFWVNEEKVFDMPKAVNTSPPMNQLFFSIAEYWPYNENNFGLYVSNIKVATGLPDSRHKLMEEGSFSTTGIMFNVNSAVIQESSFGIVKEIATVLNDNPDIKIKVIGHTDSDGDDAANMELSKKRAAAVKALLASEYKIDASRIETEGKGESKPVADNKTKEGKMQNRRVEFVKL